MKLLYSLVFITLISCTPTTVIEPTLPAQEVVDLGFLPDTLNKEDYTPYFDLRTLEFKADDGETYVFEMTQPNIIDEKRFQEVYLHPTETGKEVAYLYTGERVVFDWLSASLGARFIVTFEPGLCGDPKLDTEDKLHEHLRIVGIGFNSGDVTLRLPALDVDLTDNSICGEGRFLGNIELEGKTFNNVSYAKQELGDRYLEIYYSTERGIIAFGTSYLFAVLDRVY